MFNYSGLEPIPLHLWSFLVEFVGKCRFPGLQLFPLLTKACRSFPAIPILVWSKKVGRAEPFLNWC